MPDNPLRVRPRCLVCIQLFAHCTVMFSLFWHREYSRATCSPEARCSQLLLIDVRNVHVVSVNECSESQDLVLSLLPNWTRQENLGLGFSACLSSETRRPVTVFYHDVSGMEYYPSITKLSTPSTAPNGSRRAVL
jgi:hypothetical protein